MLNLKITMLFILKNSHQEKKAEVTYNLLKRYKEESKGIMKQTQLTYKKNIVISIFMNPWEIYL